MNYLREKVNSSLDAELLLRELGLDYRQTGTDLKIHCPFHQERTPSCYVSPPMHIFHCFGCGHKGDLVYLAARIRKKPIDFIVYEYSNKLNLKFPEKLEDVAKPEPVDEEYELKLAELNELLVHYEFLLKTYISLGRHYYHQMIEYEAMSSWAQKYYHNESTIAFYEMVIDETQRERDLLIEQHKSHKVSW